jgi:hypothetical protein
MAEEKQTLILNLDVINISIQSIDGVGHAYIDPMKC